MGGWDRSKLQMTQHPRDYRLLGNGGNDAERAASAQEARSHIQIKHPLEQPRPAPTRRLWTGITPIHTLLAWGRDDRPTPLTVQRQTATVVDQVEARPGHQRCSLLQKLPRRASRNRCAHLLDSCLRGNDTTHQRPHGLAVYLRNRHLEP
jgi:hypothetical protein